MTRLFQRECVVYVVPPGDTPESERAIAIDKLRMVFKAERSLKKDPNSLELGIYNLSATTLAKIQARHARVSLAAGYHGHLGQLFQGEARSVLPKRDGANWVAQLTCGDGAVAYSYGRANQAFAPGTKITDAIAGLAKSAKVGIGNAVQAFKKKGLQGGFDSFAHGFTASGDAQSDLDGIIRSAGCTWSIQDGQIQILTGDQDISGTAEVLSPDTGLVGSPEMGSSDKKNGPKLLKVKALLRPQIRPGTAFQVESAGIRGQFRAEKVTHEGDTFGGDWFTSIEARQL